MGGCCRGWCWRGSRSLRGRGGVGRWRGALGLRRLGVVQGGHPRGLELGQVKAELVLHAGESGGGQAVAAHVLRAHGRELRDAGLWSGL